MLHACFSPSNIRSSWVSTKVPYENLLALDLFREVERAWQTLKICSCQKEKHDSNSSYVLVFYCSEINKCYVACVKFCSTSSHSNYEFSNSWTTDPHNFQLSWLEDWYAIGLAQAWIPQDHTWMGGWNLSVGWAKQVSEPSWWSIWVLM